MALQEVLTRFGFDFDGQRLNAVQRGVKRAERNLSTIAHHTDVFQQRMGSFFQRAGQMVGAYLGYRAIRVITSDYARGADAVAKFATATGLSTQTYQGLIHAVQIGGSDQENLNKALTQLSKRALEAGQGLQTNVRAFGELGISWTDAEGKLKSGDQLFVEMADGLVNLEDKEKRTGIAMQLLGRSGATLLPTLLTGSKGIKAMIVEAEKLGKVLSVDQLKAAEEYNDEMLRVKSVLEGVRNMIASKLLPVITKQLKAFRTWWVEGNNAERALRALKAIGIFAGIVIARLITASVLRNVKMFVQGIWAGVQALRAMGVAGALTAIKIWAIIAAFALVALAVEDLIGFAKGKDSVIGRLLGPTSLAKDLKDALLGVWKAVKQAWKDLKPALLGAWTALKPALKEVWAALKPIIGPAFRTWITFLVVYLEVVATLISGVTNAVKAMSAAWDAANKAVDGWALAVENGVKSAAKAISDAWDIANKAVDGWVSTIEDGIASVVAAIKAALYYMGLLKGEKVGPTGFGKLLKEAAKVTAAPPLTSAGGPIMPGLQLPQLIGGPVQFAPGMPALAAAGQAFNIGVAEGAVQLTVHATGDPKAIAAQVAPLVKQGINAAFTDASRSLVKPPRGQS